MTTTKTTATTETPATFDDHPVLRSEAYRGTTIYLVEVSTSAPPVYLFRENDDDGKRSVQSATLYEAHEKIDKRLDAEEKVKVAKLDLKALTSRGTPFSINGLHASQGKLLGWPKNELHSYTSYGERAYPDHPEARALIARLKELEKEEQKIKSELSGLEMRYEFVSSSRQGFDMATELARLQEYYQRMTIMVERLAAKRERDRMPG